MLLEADRLGCLREVLVVVSAMSIQDPRERPARAAGAGQRGAQAVRRRALGLRRLPEPLAVPAGAAESLVRQRFSPHVQGGVPALPADPRVAGPAPAAPTGGQERGAGHLAERPPGRARPGHDAPRAPGRPAVARRVPRRGEARVPRARGAPASGSRQVRACSASSRSSSWPASSSRRPGCGRATSRASTRSGPRRRVSTSSSGPTRSRAGRRSRGAPSPPSASRSTASRSSSRGRSGMRGSTRAESRHLFIQRALVEGDWTTRHRFFHDNAALVERLSELEARTRRRDLIVGDEALYAFYDKRIPAEVVSARHFDSWWKKAGRQDPTLLTFTEDLLLSDRADQVDTDAYPTIWRQGDLDLAVTYRFEPGSPEDGVTVHVPVEVLNRVTTAGFDWQVNGLREDLVTALIRSLPKGIRRLLVPAPEHAGALVRELRERGLGPTDGPLTDVLGRVVRETRGVAVGASGLGRRPSAVSPAGALLRRGRAGSGHRSRAATSTPCARRRSPSCAGRSSRAGSSLERVGSARRGSSARSPMEVATDVGGRAPGPGLPRARRRRRLRVAARPADPGRGGGRAPARGPTAAAAQRHAALEAGAGPAQQRPEARPRRTTRTGRCPPCSTTAWPVPSTRSPRSGCRGRCGPRRPSRRRSTRSAPTWRPGWSRWSAWSSRCSPRTWRRSAGWTP